MPTAVSFAAFPRGGVPPVFVRRTAYPAPLPPVHARARPALHLVMPPKSSKLDDCADELETEPGSGYSSITGSSCESWADDERFENLEDEPLPRVEAESPEADLCKTVKPDGPPCDAQVSCDCLDTAALAPGEKDEMPRPVAFPGGPCRALVDLAILKRTRTPRSGWSLTSIPEDQPTFVRPSLPWWKRCCICSAEETSPPIRRVRSFRALDL
jgi:hypothetical protein